VVDPLIRERLDRDRHWCIYAIGDLDPRRAGYCDWYTHGEESVALLYREFDAPILFTSGDPAILDVVPLPSPCFLQIPERFLLAVENRFRLDWKRSMHRLALFNPADFRPSDNRVEVVGLGPEDEPAIRELYADGRETHEEPDFFIPTQLADGTFFGVRDPAAGLVAAGGTHLFSVPESVGAVGNIYTHRQHRGRGYAASVTSAIVAELLKRNTKTIALNVKSQNSSALRIYERLGFRHHSFYLEAFASSVNEN
jgi:ribosomal protein S18 acetylase RimI-like enzyme